MFADEDREVPEKKRLVLIRSGGGESSGRRLKAADVRH